MNPTEKNKLAVLYTLALARTPLTIQEVTIRTGKSYNTVKKVLLGDNRVKKSGKYPTRYYLAKPAELDSELVRVSDEPPKEGWVVWVGKIRAKISRLLEIDKDMHTTDVRKQGMVLEALGANLVSLGRTMQDKADEPNWYALIGGEDD